MDLFVGREAELAEALRLLFTRGEGSVIDLVGVHGLGKSALIRQLVSRVDGVNRLYIFNEDMSAFRREGFRDAFGPRASAPVLWETFARTRELMLRVTDRTRAREFDAFRQLCERETRLLGGTPKTESTGPRDPAGGDEPEAVKARIRQAQSAIDDAFVSGWAEWSRRRHILITMDSFERIADDEMGYWLARMALRLTNTLVVIARIPSPHTFTTGSNRWHVRQLPYLSRDEVVSYLEQTFHGALRPGVADVVHDFTAGHPGGLSLAANLVVETGPDKLEASDLRRTLQRLPDDPWEKWAGLVRLIVAAVRDARLSRAVHACAVVNTFDEPLLAELLTEDDNEHPDVGSVIQTLKGYGIAEQILAVADEPSDRFRLHEFIRLSLSRELRTMHPRTWQDLHQKASRHYFRLVSEWEDDTTGAYSSWYRYEHPRWQAYKREWLFHARRVSRNRTITRARFTLVFLEAFWWWGCYCPFEYNRRLLEDWERTWHQEDSLAGNVGSIAAATQHNPDDQLGEALAFVLDNYPPGYIKTDAPWNDIRNRLLLVQRLCGLGRGARVDATAEEERELGRVNGLIKIFLAHSRRFHDPADPATSRYYNEALAVFEELADDWNVAWLLFEVADLALERGALDEASAHASSSAQRLAQLAAQTDDWDEELIANLFRVRADVQWAMGNTDAAFADYYRAVVHAYRFMGVPHPPDAYNLVFYEEMTTRTVTRLCEIFSRSGIEEAKRRTEPARRLFSGTGQAGEDDVRRMFDDSDVHALRGWLFPRAPEPAELRSADSAFMDEWGVFDEDEPPSDADVELLRLG
ncbi:ATP-binding protein [Frankia sp. CiP3]|uniref:ATP-binding protein n=1 Tax=Frankia sp. CiP3 TaxID=2880971 RepID=UPI001EF63CA6|nr:ATP-binding protein [Frankia sp. CiP3]